MPAFLVSFISSTPYGVAHGSHVVDLPEAPVTMRAVLDLQATIGMEYGADAILTTWDYLPDASAHPSVTSPYSYFLTYAYKNACGGLGQGVMAFMRARPIITINDLRSAEEFVRARLQSTEVHLVSCKAVREPTPGLLSSFEQANKQAQDGE